MVKRRSRSLKRTRSAATRKRSRSRTNDPFKTSFKKRRVTRKSKKPQEKPKSRKRVAQRKQVQWKRMQRDPRVSTSRKVSTKPTGTDLAVSEPKTEAGIMKKYRPPMDTKKQDKAKEKRVKKVYQIAKHGVKELGKGIEETAKTAYKISKFVEPFLDAAAVEFPVLAPAAAGNTAFAEVGRMIERTGDTAERGKDAYKALTDTKKYQKMISAQSELPKINLIQDDPRYVPLPNYPIEQID